MPDLPNVGWERDIESFREFFENPAFRTGGWHAVAGADAALLPASIDMQCGGCNWNSEPQHTRTEAVLPTHHVTLRCAPSLPTCRRPEAVPHPGHPRHGAVRAVEEGALPQLPA